METVEVLIRIPKKKYDWLKQVGRYSLNLCENAIMDGIVLPKGHTELIDRQDLIHAIEQKAKGLKNLDTINGLCGAVALIYDMPPVIEADKEMSE